MANPAINTVIAPAPSVMSSYFSASGSMRKRWIYHVLFWIAYYLFVIVLFYSIYRSPNPRFYLQLGSYLPLEILFIYVNFYVLMPRLLFARKYIQYILMLKLGITVLALFNTGLSAFYARSGYPEFQGADFSLTTFIARAMELFYLVGFTTGIKLARSWMLHLEWIKDKEKQYLETELNFLKTQIQPHFFFNTLNNLYSLTLKKSDEAPEVVLKLSDLMSYMLYESGSGRVALQKEISYLQNYIEVEKLRFGQRLDVIFETKGETENAFIPPMILILFIENSFKHGVKNYLDHITIHISLEVKNGLLFFRVSNPVGMEGGSQAHEGIGLKNVRRRLDLLFGKNYELDTVEKDNQYIVSLKMPVW